MLPEGEYLYKNLSSEFVDVDKLINEIREERISGYLSFEGEEENEKGFVELQNGEPGRVKIYKDGEERVEDGESALKGILKNGSYTVQVVDCNESGQEIVKIKLENEEIKSDISTDDIEVPEFLSTNITDQENDCHLVLLSDGYSGIITMVDGIPEQAKISTPTEIFVGNEALKKALGYIDEGKVSLDIYRMTEAEKEEKDDIDEAIGERMKGELEGISEEFEKKADDLLNDMGLDFMMEDGEDGEETDGETGEAEEEDVFGGIETKEE
ncbi:MAG: hypothetical protein U5J64_04325 [Halobacteriales archaeon]|nr:hypothetical protein [Halobacteriales archaeon]